MTLLKEVGPADTHICQPGDVPQAIDAERAVLGTVFVDGIALDKLELEAGDFADPLHRATFDAARRLAADNRHPSAASISPILADMPAPSQRLTVAEYLLSLDAYAVPQEHVATYSAAVLDAAVRRRIIGAANAAIAAMRSPRSLISEAGAALLGDVSEALTRQGAGSRIGRHAGEAAACLLDKIGKPEAAGKVRTGLSDLDRITGPLLPGMQVVLGGGTGSFKTTLGLQIALNAAAGGASVAIISQEMRDEDLAERMLANVSIGLGRPIPAADIRGVKENDEARLGILIRASGLIAGLPIHIADKPGMRVAEIAAYLRQLGHDQCRAFDLCFVDYLGLLSAEGRYRGQKVNEVGELSTSLKRLAMSAGCVMLTLHQLSRAPNGRDNKRPQKSDLRDSGQIEQDADKILMTFREASEIERDLAFQATQTGDHAATRREELRSRLAKVFDALEVGVVKNRQGAENSALLHVSPKFFHISCRAHHTKPEDR